MISIITPVWNRSDLTAQYLFSNHIHYPTDPGIQWIIIDNGSTDGTQGILQYWGDIIGSRLVILGNDKNEGFSAACNQGAKRAEGDTLLFLNNDVLVKGDYISPLEKIIRIYPNALAGPQILNFDTGWNKFGDKLISYIAGWCLAMRKVVFQELGGFDEQFSPAYYEDIDLCYNALQKGFEFHQTWLPIQHLGEETGKQLGDDKLKITLANKKKFAKKWRLQ